MTEPDTITREPAPTKFSGLAGLAVITVTMPTLFWLGFGIVDGFAYGFTAFLVLLAAAVEYLPQLTERVAGTGSAPFAKLKPRWFDRLGVVWLLSIPFAPFVTWVLRNAMDLDSTNWFWPLGLSALFCVVVPIVCVLPLLRYVRRGTAGVALTILAAGTGFPVATGAGSAYDFVFGPVWQEIEIVRPIDIDYMTRSGRIMSIDAAYVDLADGRRLSRASTVPLQVGKAQALVLRGVGRIIAVRP